MLREGRLAGLGDESYDEEGKRIEANWVSKESGGFYTSKLRETCTIAD